MPYDPTIDFTFAYCPSCGGGNIQLTKWMAMGGKVRRCGDCRLTFHVLREVLADEDSED